jgi:hypothetical protein
MFDRAAESDSNDEWFTPAWVFDALGIVFDLDPCSPGSPPSTVRAIRCLTKEQNGLASPWAGTVWLNPPFSSKGEWYRKFARHGNGIALMPARTEAIDMQDLMAGADALLFMKSRMYFERGHRPTANCNGATTTPPFGIVFCAYGKGMAEVLLRSRIIGVRAKVWPAQAGGEDS